MDNETVKDLIKRIQNGDSTAMDCLYKDFRIFGNNIMSKYSNKGVDSQDIKQQIDLSFCEGVNIYDENLFDNAPVYLIKKVKNDVWTFYRKEQGYKKVKGNDILIDSTELEEMIPRQGDECLSRELMDLGVIIHSALEYLSEDDKQIIEWYYFKELTQEEIGLKIGISKQGVEKKLKRILKKLKNIIE